MRYNKKRKLRVQKLLSEGAELDENYIEKTTTCRSHASYRCSICGSTDHYAPKCKKPADGLGNIMSTKDQNKYMDEGFLIIEIGDFIGSTIIPQSSEEYDMMRSNSKFSTVSVKFENRRNVNFHVDPQYVHDSNQQNNIQTPAHTLDDIDYDSSVPHEQFDGDDIPHVTQEESVGITTEDNENVSDIELTQIPTNQNNRTDANGINDDNANDDDNNINQVHPHVVIVGPPTDDNVILDCNEDEDNNTTHNVHPYVEMLGSRLQESYCAAGMLCDFIRDFVPGQKGPINGPAYEHHEDVPANAEALYWQDNGGVVCHNCKNSVHKKCCVRILPYISGRGEFGMFCRTCVQNPNDVKEALESFRRTETDLNKTL